MKDVIRAQLDNMDQKVTLWMRSNLSSFSINLMKIKDDEQLEREMKAFCELCFLCNFLTDDLPFTKEIKKYLKLLIENNDYEALVVHNPGAFMGLLAVDSFSLINFNASIFKNLNIIDIASLYLKSPFRMVEISTFLQLNYNYLLEETQYYKSQTILALDKNVNSLNDLDIYSITHELFYIYFQQQALLQPKTLTEMVAEEVEGQASVPNVHIKDRVSNYIGADPNQLKTKLLSLAIYLCNEGNIDILLEILLCLGLFKFNFTAKEWAILTSIITFIAKLQSSDGSIVPHLHTNHSQHVVTSFYDLYHTTSILKGLIDIWKLQL